MGKREKLEKIAKFLPNLPVELHLGDGRTITVSPADKYDMFRSALGDGDHPLLCSARSSRNVEAADPFVLFLMALEGDRRTIPDDYEKQEGSRILRGDPGDLSE
jgi:hypothetical protein